MNAASMPSSALDAALDIRFCQDLFGALRVATFDGVGITRESFGAGESTALDIVEASARKLGLATERDLGANLVVTLAGTEPDLSFLCCGAHLASVPQGGNFHRGAGQRPGLGVVAFLKKGGFEPRRDH